MDLSLELHKSVECDFKGKKTGSRFALDPVRLRLVPIEASLYTVSCQLPINTVASFNQS